MIFKKNSYPVGKSKVETLEGLMKQIDRQMPEMIDDLASESDAIKLNKILMLHVKPSLIALKEIVNKIETNGEY